jgi:hypothetical protein
MQVADYFRRRWLLTLILAAVAAALGGCGSSSTTTRTKTVAAAPASAKSTSQSTSSTSRSSTSTAVTKAEAGKQYLTIAAPLNATAKQVFASIKDSDNGQQVATKAKPLVAALNTANHQLITLASDYPTASSDLKALVKDDSALVADLTDVANVNGLSESSWAQQVSRDESQDAAAVNIVRSDLGLPQKSS